MDSRIYELVKKYENPSERIEAILNVVEPSRSPEVVAYLLKQSLEVFPSTPHVHDALIRRIPDEVIGGFVPGLLSSYFRVLKDSKTRAGLRDTAIRSIEYVLGLEISLDEISETNIHDFFYFNRKDEFERIYVICVQRFKTSRKAFFISQLILLDYNRLADCDYALLNRSIEEVFSLEVIDKLLSIGRYENNENVFNKLVDMYKRGENVEGIILKIQQRFRVQNYVLELCPVSETTTREILLTNDLKKIEIFLRNTEHVPLQTEVVKKYLELCISSEDILRSGFNRKFNISRIISEDYDEFLEYAFSRMNENVNVLINLINIEFRPKVDEFIFRSIEFVHQCFDPEELGQHLYFLKIVVGKDCLRRSVLRRIFDGLVYLDHSDHRVRCAKYEIFSELLGQYALLDEAAEYKLHAGEVEAGSKDPDLEVGLELCLGEVRKLHDESSNNLLRRRSHIQDISALMNRSNAMRRADTGEIDEDNVKVLVAMLWDELSITPVESELVAVSLLLKKIIDLTGSFYEARMTKSNFIFYLIDQHRISKFNEVKRRRMDVFFSLLESMIMKFYLSKNVFNILLSILLDYFHIFDVEYLIRLMVEKDRYYCLYILYKHSICDERKLSEKLKIFLKKALAETPK